MGSAIDGGPTNAINDFVDQPAVFSEMCNYRQRDSIPNNATNGNTEEIGGNDVFS